MAKITFGLGNEAQRNYNTLDELRNDANLQAFLGYGANVDFFINGTLVPGNVELTGESVISIQTRAAEKARRC